MCNQECNQGALNFVLSLLEIAAWSEPDKPAVGGEQIFAAIPALQRGLVWKPKQIELLWDSLLRGIPVGSFVVCQKLPSQMKTNQKALDRVTHHLLDGQQRANAIFLGFAPFPADDSPILWLDLNPKMGSNTTRNFGVRLTTLAHPWGYTWSDTDDASSRLSAHDMHTAIDMADRTDAASTKRPRPFELKPYSANVPVPLSVFLNANAETEVAFWSSVDATLAKYNQKWAMTARVHLAQVRTDVSGTQQAGLTKLYAGVCRANAARIIALNAPAELLEPSQMESTPSPNENQNKNITNIEHLFQRLNQQGTTLNGEELAYSMIKAYWPEIADDIDRCASGRMPASRLATLAVRCVLSDGASRLHAPISVSRIRKLSTASDIELRDKIIFFIRKELEAICLRVDCWLGVPDKDNKRPDWGLLKVHRTGIAIQAPEIYLLLLWLAWKYPETDEALFPRITGLATTMSWFGTDHVKLANAVFEKTQAGFGLQQIGMILAEKTGAIKPILHPDDYRRLMELPAPEDVQCNPASLSAWEWEMLHANIQKMFPAAADEEKRKRKIEEWWPSLLAIIAMQQHSGQYLLLYVQRGYLAKRFPDYDPARRDLWEAHNRPWDFDHILPNSFTYYQRGEFCSVCSKWVGLIGNMRAVPFEENRSDQANPAAAKINTPEKRADSFLPIDMETICVGLFQDKTTIHDPQKALAFVTACRDRIVAIYREWYNALKIETLVPRDQCMK